MPLPVSDNDPTYVASLVNTALDDMHANGISTTNTTKLRDFIATTTPDLFRTSISNDPPARMPPVQLEVDQELFNKLRPPPIRKFSAEHSKFLADTMAKLERYGYVYHNPGSTFGSPAYPVRKFGVEPTAPLQDQLRCVVDMRAINSATRPTVTPIPNQDTFATYVTGAQFFGKLDLSNGYWQMEVHPDSQKYMTIVTDRGVYTSRRLLQGSRNAAGPFHAAVSKVLEAHISRACILFIDDILVFAKTEDDFINAWIAILDALNTVGLKVSAKKTTFYSPEITFCGRVYSADGVRFNPEFVHTVTHMAKPTTVAELRTYLASANWMRGSIVKFTEMAAPLQSLLTQALSITTKTTQRAVAKILLSNHGWNATHDAAFNDINAAIAASTLMAYPNDSMQLCVFTDASDDFYAGIVTQCDPAELAKPMLQQHHQPLAFVSGKFNATEHKWPTIEKEGFAIKATCTKSTYFLQRPTGFIIFTDHANLGFLFSQDTAVANGRKQAADRIERWLIAMRKYNYDIRYIKGPDNFISDMFSRWASPHKRETPPLDPTIIALHKAMAVARRQVPPATLAVHNTASPHQFNMDVAVTFEVDDVPTEQEIKDAQATGTSSNDITTLKLTKNTAGLLIDAAQRVYVPDNRHLRSACALWHTKAQQDTAA